jgi:NAD(P) transhydrogenase
MMEGGTPPQPMPPEKFDLIVIGSGPAGEKGAVQAAYFGKRVALVEKEACLGGAAANTGTLPSKTLRETAVFLSGFRQRELYGLEVGVKKRVGVRDFMARERFITDQERERIYQNLLRHKVTVYRGFATLLDPHTVAVRPERCPELQLHGDFILIATGSYPYRPRDLPFHDPRVYDSDNVLSLSEMPHSLLVVGGGIIGCEYACTFAALGTHVTVVEKRGSIAGGMDGEIVEALRNRMMAMGVRFHLNDSVAEVHCEHHLNVRLRSGEVLPASAMLVSSGRCGATEGLGLDKGGVTVTERGQVPVNSVFQTNVPHIYAAGDVIGNPALASTAMEQARMAVVHAFDLKYKSGVATILPYGLYTIPECALAGDTEEALIAAKVPYVAGRASYGLNARGQIIGDHHGFLKLLFHAGDRKLLGVHLIGEQATELVHIGLTALMLGAGTDLFINTCYNYPTLSELYKYATYDALGRF